MTIGVIYIPRQFNTQRRFQTFYANESLFSGERLDQIKIESLASKGVRSGKEKLDNQIGLLNCRANMNSDDPKIQSLNSTKTYSNLS